jgi:acyl-coenzyme A thioesterase PaaI-like protein
MATTTLSNPVQSLVDGKTNFIRAAWDKLSPLPGGKILFSKMVGRAAPYTGSIDGRVEELDRGFARVSMRDRKSVRNHLDCVHAIALLNLAELTGNIALSYTLPDDARFIVAGMSIDYLKKARGTIYGVCRVPPVESSEKREYEVQVDLENLSGEVVARSTLRTLVGPKKNS